MEKEERACREDNNENDSHARLLDTSADFTSPGKEEQNFSDSVFDLLQPNPRKTVNGTMGGGGGGRGAFGTGGGITEHIRHICQGVMAGTEDSACRLLIRSGAVLFRNTRSRGMFLGGLCLLTLTCMLMTSTLLSPESDMNFDVESMSDGNQLSARMRRIKVEVSHCLHGPR